MGSSAEACGGKSEALYSTGQGQASLSPLSSLLCSSSSLPAQRQKAFRTRAQPRFIFFNAKSSVCISE